MFIHSILQTDTIDPDVALTVLADPNAMLFTSLAGFMLAVSLVLLVGTFASSVAVVQAHPDWEYEQVQQSLAVRICLYGSLSCGIAALIIHSLLDTI